VDHLPSLIQCVRCRPAEEMHPNLSAMLVAMILLGVTHAHRRSEFSYYICSVRDLFVALDGGWVGGLPTQVFPFQPDSRHNTPPQHPVSEVELPSPNLHPPIVVGYLLTAFVF
jgi:hypothetical protein